MAEMCAQFERLIGTQGGGMDQAACLLANGSVSEASAVSRIQSACFTPFLRVLQPLLIEFTKPRLTTTPVRIPPGGVFVIADCGVRLNKAATPDYNTRISQCKEAAKVIIILITKNNKFY